MREHATGDRMIALFLLGLLLFSPPLLVMFGSATPVLGVPLLVAYLFGAWALLILAVMLAVRAAHAQDERRDDGPPEA